MIRACLILGDTVLLLLTCGVATSENVKVSWPTTTGATAGPARVSQHRGEHVVVHGRTDVAATRRRTIVRPVVGRSVTVEGSHLTLGPFLCRWRSTAKSGRELLCVRSIESK